MLKHPKPYGPIGRIGAALVLTLVCAGLPQGAAYAQAPEAAADVEAARWAWYVDGRPAPDAAPGPPVDSLDAAVRAAVEALQREGFYFAGLDSARVDSGAAGPLVRLYLQRGPVVPVGGVRIEGAAALQEAVLRGEMDTRPGRPLVPETLEADIARILGRYADAGYPLAQIVIERIDLEAGAAPALDVVLRVEEGVRPRLRGVELVGAEHTRGAFAARLAGLRPGATLTGYDAENIRQRLLEAGLFKQVGRPKLVVVPDSSVVVRIAVEEEPPGAFDLVLGYLPSSGGSGGGLVGSGHLVLRNLFGGGHGAALRLNRMPGRVSSVDVRLSDPFLFGLPVSGEVRFEGLQDSTLYGKQRFAGELGYRFPRGLHAFATLSRERTRPGARGASLALQQQRVPRSEAWFVGLGVRLRRLDQPLNPRRGYLFEANLERGLKERSLTFVRPAGGDTVRERTALRQDRLQVRARLYLPTFARQVVALGGDAALLASSAYDPSDLFRFGGANTLRGYDEEFFLGRSVARLLGEYRYQIDRTSYAYAFGDLGFVEAPALPDRAPLRGFYPGYGFGIQFSTDLGIINASYAVSPQDGPTGGRVHVGLSFGL